eukprot:COSAG01_NODE_1829_length_9125_cov_11.706182_1_plen_396_part_00
MLPAAAPALASRLSRLPRRCRPARPWDSPRLVRGATYTRGHRYLLRDELTFTHSAALRLREELGAAGQRMEALVSALASGEASLAEAVAAAQARIAALEGKLSQLREEASAKAAEVMGQLKAAREEITALEEVKAGLEKQVEEAAAKLMGIEKQIAHAVQAAYKPDALAQRLREMMEDGTIAEMFRQMEPADKLALFRLLVNSCDVDGKHDVMKEVAGSFLAGEMDVGTIASNMHLMEQEKLLQILLKEFNYEPSKILQQLGGEGDEEAQGRLATTAEGIITHSLARGCERQPLLDALAFDRDALIAGLLEQLGLRVFLRELGVEVADLVRGRRDPPPPIPTPSSFLFFCLPSSSISLASASPAVPSTRTGGPECEQAGRPHPPHRRNGQCGHTD